MKIQPEYQAALMKNQKERQKRQEDRLRKKEGRPETPDLSKLDEIRIPDSTKLDCVSSFLSLFFAASASVIALRTRSHLKVNRLF